MLDHGGRRRRCAGLLPGAGSQRTLVLVGEHLDEPLQGVVPVVEDFSGTYGTRPAVVTLDQAAQLRLVGLTAVRVAA